MYFLQSIKCPYCGEKQDEIDYYGVPCNAERYTCEYCEKEFKIETDFISSEATNSEATKTN